MLNNIIASSKNTVERQEKILPLDILLTKLSISTRNFRSALQKNKPAFIFECKHYSPSMGKLRDTYPIQQIAIKYAQFADAISVLTNAAYFGGSFEHLQQVSEVVDKPVLCKDIIVSPYQVALARLYQADAVLLMLSVLTDEEYIACSFLAHQYNMAVLTEVFTKDELIRAIHLKANIIDINHRNLHTMQLDMERVVKLSNNFPQDAIMIAASGIHAHHQIQNLNPYVHGFLIGSSLSKSNYPELKTRELIFSNIKICGLTTPQDAQQAYHCGANFGGLIFAENSLRKISLEKAKKIVNASPLQYIGVFVNQTISFVTSIAESLNLYAVQLHGGESAEYILKLRLKLPENCQIYQAISAENIPNSLPKNVSKLLVDSSIVNGGTGKTFNWDIVKSSPLLPDIIIGGGITVHNIMQAKNLKSWGLDINSGVEQSPGIKDHEKLVHLFTQLRQEAT